ncbi:hypothetical protein [Maribacter sp. 4G9]|jgi:hypothetical protein|uniref:hypothetical protein n=1 Tax=Maribacter sp. 4G9 TaxID=1889777 RepID=UPI0013FD814C|nr:hypothetical protein [Maribacter sp. 4G9]|tara:strand:- start:20 stop:184 length:165 start_codon:yes stop_codon:yes gene_type:complete
MTDFFERANSPIRPGLAGCHERIIKMNNDKNAMLIPEIYRKRILVNLQKLGHEL